MKRWPCVAVLAASGWLACAAGGAAPDAKSSPPAAKPASPVPAALESLALLPKETVAFVHVPDLQALDGDLKRFARETGWRLGEGERPALDLFVKRTGLATGLAGDGSATIGFVDPKRFRQRFTIFVVPVADWDALLRAAGGEEMSPHLYALTGAAGPRFVARRGRHAVVTSSIRTMDALLEAESLLASLGRETQTRASGHGPVLFVNVHRLTRIYEAEMLDWFRAVSGQMYYQPEATAYADVLVAYLQGIAGFIDQMETAEAALRFGPEGLSADLAVRFVRGAGVANFLSAQPPGAAPIPTLTARPLASTTTLRLDPKGRTDTLLAMTQFFLEKSPRPEPLPEPTREQVMQAVRVLAESLGPQMTFLSAPAAPGRGLTTEVTVLDLADPDGFRKGIELMVAAWERLADQLNLYVRFQTVEDPEDADGVRVTQYLPRLRFGIPARHVEFRQRLRDLYGPDGLVYRVAVVGRHAVIATGSDQQLFREVIQRLRDSRGGAEAPALQRLAGHLPQNQSLLMALNLPLGLGQSLLRGGTPPDRVGSIDPGHDLAGISIAADGDTARVATYWPHEQIRLVRDLMRRAAPELSDMPESLFEPPAEGPPKAAPGAPAPAGYGPP